MSTKAWLASLSHNNQLISHSFPWSSHMAPPQSRLLSQKAAQFLPATRLDTRLAVSVIVLIYCIFLFHWPEESNRGSFIWSALGFKFGKILSTCGIGKWESLQFKDNIEPWNISTVAIFCQNLKKCQGKVNILASWLNLHHLKI